MKRALIALLAALTLPAAAQPAPAPEPRELIYCADLMSHEEREAYRAKMRAASRDEKEALRAAHRQDMQERAAKAGRAGECETAGRQWRGGQGR